MRTYHDFDVDALWVTQGYWIDGTFVETQRWLIPGTWED